MIIIFVFLNDILNVEWLDLCDKKQEKVADLLFSHQDSRSQVSLWAMDEEEHPKGTNLLNSWQ